MGILNQIGNIGNKPNFNRAINRCYKQEILDLLQDSYFDEKKLKIMKELGFSLNVIVNRYSEIKLLLQLVFNGLNIEFISLEDLKYIIRKNNGDIDLIRSELTNKIDINKYSFKEQSLLLSILHR